MNLISLSFNSINQFIVADMNNNISFFIGLVGVSETI